MGHRKLSIVVQQMLEWYKADLACAHGVNT